MNNKITINGQIYRRVDDYLTESVHSTYGKKVNRSASMKYDLMGDNLPDGSSDLYFVSNAWGTTIVVYIYGVDEDSGQLALTVMNNGREMGVWATEFNAKNLKSAVKKFDQICELVDDKKLSPDRIAKKFKLKKY